MSTKIQKKTMVAYANGKINIGLHITGKRADGYHDIETVLYPFGCCDIVEITEKKSGQTSLEISGIALSADADNLCLRAYRLLRQQHELPPVHIHLHKQLPFGAGLGGGSSDGATVLKMLGERYGLGLSVAELEGLAAKLGADCPFFIRNIPAYATGIGTELRPVDLDLTGYRLLLVKPDIHVSTAEAYRGVRPKPAETDLRTAIKLPLREWKHCIRNDFEKAVFARHRDIAALKEAMYAAGAHYAAMSGSGSAVFGIFEENAALPDFADFAGFGENSILSFNFSER